MKPEIKFIESAFKHGAKEEDIFSALDTFVLEAALKGEAEKFLTVGFDTNGNLLEVMYNLTDDNVMVIFHAMKCCKKYINMIER